MKKVVKIFLMILAAALVGGWFYWQQHKKGIVKNTIENALAKGSDSLYFVHYDSSYIDEVNGNASFFNVVLQSDSLQRQLSIFDTASAATIYNVHVDEVTVMGADITGLISNTRVKADLILLKRPVIYIISSGKKKEKNLLTSADTLQIYEKLLGKFNSINAKEIKITDGYLYFTDKTGKPNTALENIAIDLKNFGIDSTKDYQNIISYFVKGIVAKVNAVTVNGDNNQAIFTNVEYNAPEKLLYIKNFQQKNKNQQVVFNVNNTSITNISTDAFILQQLLKAEELKSDGGLLTFYRKQTKDSTRDNIEIDNNYFDEAQLNKVTIGNTKILIYNTEKPNQEPFTLTNVKFNATDIQKLYAGTSVKKLISTSAWKLSADGFSFFTDNKRYKMNVGPFDINNGNATMRIKNFSMMPTLSEEAFSRSISHQEDLYKLEVNNIELTGIDTRLLINDKKLVAATAKIQPVFNVYRDRTVAEDLSSKVGKYPHQLIQKVKLPFSIQKLTINNGSVTYREKSEVSDKTGTVFFKNINGTIVNVTNLPELISKNNLMVLNATGSFMGVSQVQTTWKLPLNTQNGTFDVSGTAGSFNAPSINPMVEALGMTSIKSGKVQKLTFSITGNDNSAKGTSTLLYEDLKIEMLKKDSTETKKKGLMSLLANALINDMNPKNGQTRLGDIVYDRDKTKSFFNLIWKSIFSGIKKTAQKL